MLDIPYLAVGFGLHPSLGTDKLLPPAASLLAAGKGFREASKGFIPASFDGTDFPTGDNKAGTVFGANSNRVDLADVDTGTYTCDRFRLRVVCGITEDVPAFPPHDFAGVNFHGRDKASVEPDSGREGENQGAVFSRADRHLV